MALIVEDGTGVTAAGTYADLAYVRAYALARGVTLTATDSDLEPLVHKSMDYLDTRELGLLSVAWPLVDGVLCGSNVTTAQALERLKRSQGELCIEQTNGVDLSPTRTDAFITEETVGPLTTKYDGQYGGGDGIAPNMLTVDSLLSPLEAACGHVGIFETVRA